MVRGSLLFLLKPIDVFDSIEELQCLQGLHLWKIVNMDLSSVELLYDSKYQVIIPCRRFTPVPEGLQVSPIVNTKQDDFPLVGQLMVALASRYAVQSEAKATLRSVMVSKRSMNLLTSFLIDHTKALGFLGFVFSIAMAIKFYYY